MENKRFWNSQIWTVFTLFLAEFFGTAMLLFGGCMASTDGFDNVTSNISRGITFGMVVMMAFITFSASSGAIINPVVSLAAYIFGTLSLQLTILYIVAQFAGALCGYGLLRAVTPWQYYQQALEHGNAHCVTVPHQSLSSGMALAVEILLTGMLVWTNCGVWDPRNKKDSDSVPVKFAFLIAGLSIAGGPITGASMNPARSLAPAIWNHYYEGLWIYFAGPTIGSLLMVTIYRYIFLQKCSDTSEMMSPCNCHHDTGKQDPHSSKIVP
uniref:Aquaglyceroporin n=1 Tax=Anopheles gambiae TaxID=7165 RepID=A0A0A7DN44_ANOGA|nr:aquaglyceroporin [Anopheles gambiae]